MKKYALYNAAHTGSEIIESALILCNAPYELIPVDYEEVAHGKIAALKKINPLSRLPTLITPKGAVLTESGAILIHLAHAFPKAKLIPEMGEPGEDLFYRLLFILTGEIYPCFTFMDDPSEWIKSKAAREPYRKAVLKHHKEIWLAFSKFLSPKGPWALGKEFSAIDLYLASMGAWRPRMKWFKMHAPRVFEIAQKTRGIKSLKRIYDHA